MSDVEVIRVFTFLALCNTVILVVMVANCYRKIKELMEDIS